MKQTDIENKRLADSSAAVVSGAIDIPRVADMASPHAVDAVSQVEATGVASTANSSCGNMRTLVVIPAYNESANIASTVQDVRENAPFVDVLVINDGSTDDTAEILAANAIPHVNLIRNLGIGGAVQTGYKYALRHGYDIVVQFDGDGQHRSEYIQALIEPIACGEADLVVGSRFKGSLDGFKSSAMRRLGINILSAVLKAASTNKVQDVTSGFRAAGRRAVELFAGYYPDDYPEPESLALIARKGLKVSEIPVAMRERTGGVSSIKKMDSVYYMIKVTIAVLIQTNVYERRAR